MQRKTTTQRQALPGSEAVRVRVWECKECGDRWSIRGSEDERAVAVLIKHHSGFFHRGEPVPGHYYTWSVIRPPRYDLTEEVAQ